MRLTNLMRDRIVTAAEKAAFATRRAEVKQRETVLARTIIARLLTPAELCAVENLPIKFFNDGGYFFAKKDEDGSKNYVHITAPSGIRVPEHIMQSTHIVPDDVWDDIMKWVHDVQKIAYDSKAFLEQTRGVVGAYTNSEKLLQDWTTLRDLMPEGFFKERQRSQLPAHNTIAELDAALQAGRPFEAELAQAA